MIDRKFIGFSTEPSSVTADPWRVKLFCQATGETDSRAWQPGQMLPPTFLKAIETEHHSSAALLQSMNLRLQGVLHAEQGFERLAPVHVGDTIEVQRQVANIYDKKGGALNFIDVETRYRVGGRTVATSRQTILVRIPVPTS